MKNKLGNKGSGPFGGRTRTPFRAEDFKSAGRARTVAKRRESGRTRDRSRPFAPPIPPVSPPSDPILVVTVIAVRVGRRRRAA